MGDPGWRLLKHVAHTRTGSYRCSFGRGTVFSEQFAQMTLPQFLQNSLHLVNEDTRYPKTGFRISYAKLPYSESFTMEK